MDESLALGVIAEQLGVPVDSLSAETAFADLNADSLELFQIIVALEEKFDIEFDNDRAESIKLVGDVLQSWLRQRKKNKYEPSESGRI